MISVLYVDDEPDLLDLTKRYLEMEKEFVVSTAPSAAAALDLLKSDEIQAIVSDYQMPGMDGIEFLKLVRSFDTNIPFILFTGKGREEIAVEAFENGADSYVQRGGPIQPQFVELVHKIKMAVDRRRAEAQVKALYRLYTVLSATNKAIVHVHDKKELLNEICRIVIEIGGLKMAWAGLANPTTHVIEPVAAYGHEEGYLETVSISTDDVPRGRGPTGTAFREGTFNVCNDIANDVKMAPWRSIALERGYHSVAAFPFGLGTENAGVMTFYAAETEFFNDPIIRLLDEQSQDISFALLTLDHEEQRTTAENKLKASELQYRKLFETSQHAIMILDGDTFEITDANTYICDMLGYPLDYFVGRHLWELGFIKGKPLQKEAFSGLRTSGYTRCEDLGLETREGKVIDVELISNVNLVGDKRIIQCTLRDITDRKMAERALKESEAKFKTLFESASDAVFIMDSTVFLDCNPSTEVMFGRARDGIIGHSMAEFSQEKQPDGRLSAESAEEKIEAALNGKPQSFEWVYVRSDGTPFNAEVTFTRVLLRGVYNLQATVRDITERTLMSDKIKASLIEKETLLKEIHHRVKNNIQVITSILHIQSEQTDDPAVKEIFWETQNKVKGIALIHEKLYQNKSLSEIDYADYLKSITTYMFQTYNVNSRQINLIIDAQDVVINIDNAVPLSLIVNEMLTNSLKHAFPGGRKGEIVIGLKNENGMIVLNYSDNGIGMPESITFDTSNSLGMSLLSGLTRQLSGRITLDRTGGTRYTLTFPAESQVGGVQRAHL